MNDITKNDVMENRIIIPVNGIGILDDAAATTILADENNRRLIEDRDTLIALMIGRSVTATAPEFWQTLLSGAMKNYKNELEQETDSRRAEEVGVLIVTKFKVEYEEGIPSAKERLLELSKIAHRFEGLVNPYQNYASERKLGLGFEELGRPEIAEQCRQRANKWAIAIEKGFG